MSMHSSQAFNLYGEFLQNCHCCYFPVYYEDTDAGGVVFYGNYLKFAERCRTNMLNLLGMFQRDLAQKEGIFFVVRRVQVEYYKSSRLDDVLKILTFIDKVSKITMTFRHEFYVDDILVCSMDVLVVCIHKETLSPTRISVSILEKLWQKSMIQ